MCKEKTITTVICKNSRSKLSIKQKNRKRTQQKKQKRKGVCIMGLQILKSIFIFFTVLYAISKIVNEIDNKYKNNKDKIVNLIEIIISITLTFIIFKI